MTALSPWPRKIRSSIRASRATRTFTGTTLANTQWSTKTQGSVRFQRTIRTLQTTTRSLATRRNRDGIGCAIATTMSLPTRRRRRRRHLRRRRHRCHRRQRHRHRRRRRRIPQWRPCMASTPLTSTSTTAVRRRRAFKMVGAWLSFEARRNTAPFMRCYKRRSLLQPGLVASALTMCCPGWSDRPRATREPSPGRDVRASKPRVHARATWPSPFRLQPIAAGRACAMRPPFRFRRALGPTRIRASSPRALRSNSTRCVRATTPCHRTLRPIVGKRAAVDLEDGIHRGRARQRRDRIASPLRMTWAPLCPVRGTRASAS